MIVNRRDFFDSGISDNFIGERNGKELREGGRDFEDGSGELAFAGGLGLLVDGHADNLHSEHERHPERDGEGGEERAPQTGAKVAEGEEEHGESLIHCIANLSLVVRWSVTSATSSSCSPRARVKRASSSN